MQMLIESDVQKQDIYLEISMPCLYFSLVFFEGEVKSLFFCASVVSPVFLHLNVPLKTLYPFLSKFSNWMISLNILPDYAVYDVLEDYVL